MAHGTHPALVTFQQPMHACRSVHGLYPYSPHDSPHTRVRRPIWWRKETMMGQVNVNEPEPGAPRDEGAGRAAICKLTWALAAVIVIAAVVMAIIDLTYSLHP